MQSQQQPETFDQFQRVAFFDPFIDRLPYGSYKRLSSASKTYRNSFLTPESQRAILSRFNRSEDAWRALGTLPSPEQEGRALIPMSHSQYIRGKKIFRVKERVNQEALIPALEQNFHIDVLDVTTLWKSMTVDLAAALNAAFWNGHIYDVISYDFWINRANARGTGGRSYISSLFRDMPHIPFNPHKMLMEMMRSKKVSAGFMWLMLNRLKVLRMDSSHDPPRWSVKFETALKLNTTIHTLNLSEAYSRHSDGRPMQHSTKEALARVISDGLPNLTTLNLTNCFLGDRGAIMLLEALKQRKERMTSNTRSYDILTQVYLANNGITPPVLSEFQRFFRRFRIDMGNRTFIRLELDPQSEPDSDFEVSDDNDSSGSSDSSDGGDDSDDSDDN